MSNLVRALFLPFESGALCGLAGRSAFAIRALSDPSVPNSLRSTLVCEQTFKPHYDQLVADGFRTVMELQGRFDLGLCLLTRHRAENQANVARAWSHLRPGGDLVCAGEKASGAAAFERQVRGAVGLEGQLAKWHCRIFWVKKRLHGSAAPPLDWFTLNRLERRVADSYLTRPGIFSWQQVDPGSRLLAQHLPAEISGDVADLGAGWGYLSDCLLRQRPQIRCLHLYEAEHLALQAARGNIVPGGAKIEYYWHDVTAGLPGDRRYDWVVTNPPFHIARKAVPELGKAFIRAAAQALRRNGATILVANRTLPYEACLLENFEAVDRIVERDGFKVLLARRPRPTRPEHALGEQVGPASRRKAR